MLLAFVNPFDKNECLCYNEKTGKNRYIDRKDCTTEKEGIMRKIVLRIVAIMLSVCLISSGRESAIAVIPIVPMNSSVNLCGIIADDGGDRTGWQTEAANWLSAIPNSTVYTYTAFTATQL